VAKPTTLPEWDTTVANITEPVTEKSVGWGVAQAPPAQYFNWLHYWTYRWIEWLTNTSGMVAEAWAWTGRHSFTRSHATESAVGISNAGGGNALDVTGKSTLAGSLTVTTTDGSTAASVTSSGVGSDPAMIVSKVGGVAIRATGGIEVQSASNITTLGSIYADSGTVHAATVASNGAVTAIGAVSGATLTATGTVSGSHVTGIATVVNGVGVSGTAGSGALGVGTKGVGTVGTGISGVVTTGVGVNGESTGSSDGMVDITNIVSGKVYVINIVGNSNWTLIGSPANQMGVMFRATGPGTGSGNALHTPLGGWMSSVEGIGLAVSGNATRGAVLYVPQVPVPSTPTEGCMYYDHGLHKLRCWDGGTWRSFW